MRVASHPGKGRHGPVPHVFLLLACLGASIGLGCDEAELTSARCDRDVLIDGVSTEWDGAFTFLEEAEKANADVIALSALLTTTMPAQMEVIEALNSQGVRDKYKVIVGGAPVDQEWADKIGAEAYGRDAAQAVELVEKLCR